MQNIVVDMCEKFHNDRLRNDRSLQDGKSDNNKKKKNNNNNNKNNNNDNNNNVRGAWKPVSGSKRKVSK